MTSGPRQQDYMRHMQEAAQLSQDYTAGMDLAAFLADSRTQKAVFFNSVVLGQAARHHRGRAIAERDGPSACSSFLNPGAA